MPCWMSRTASLTINSASRIDAAISMRVEAPALKMMTPPAMDAAMRFITMKMMKIWVRTERPNHRKFNTPMRHGTDDLRAFCTSARMEVLLAARSFGAGSIGLSLPVSLPGLTGQSSIHGRWLLDRPVKPGDDSRTSVNLIKKALRNLSSTGRLYGPTPCAQPCGAKSHSSVADLRVSDQDKPQGYQ